MQRLWGEPPWRRIEVPTRPLAAEPEVAIVGGGLTGVSAAYHLARRGVRAALLEAGALGDGASGHSGGIVLEGTAAGVLDGVSACVPGLERLVQDAALDCELRLPGCWEIEHQCGRGGDALPWTDNDSPVRVARAVRGGTVDPLALLTGIARAAVSAGAVIHECAPVRRLFIGPRPALELDGVRIRPGSVVVGLNAWIGALLPGVRPLTSALTLACATEPLDAPTLREIGLGPGLPFYTIDLPYLWGRLLGDGRVIFGAGLVFGSPQELERLDIRVGDPKAVFARLEARVRGLHPALAEVRFSTRWAGPVAFADDHLPLLGRVPDAPAVLVAGGYAGHGVALSVRAGELVARAIVEREPLPPWGAVSR